MDLSGRFVSTMKTFVAMMVLLTQHSGGLLLRQTTTHTTSGVVVGERRLEDYNIGPGALTDTVDIYRGVPYAAPPVGKRRFQPPVAPEPWAGKRGCTEQAKVCPQITYYSQTVPELQDEDCLTLDIYTPVVPGHHKGNVHYPVMLFIHGGSYEEGSGVRYSGFTLAQHGVVVVTMNYRLGVLGYLTTGDYRLPGNLGLRDQIQALRWIQENIKHFRGRHHQVTVFGSSAGSASVGLLMVTPSAKGLFHRAILQSGSPLSFWAVHNDTVDHQGFLRGVAMRVGCGHSNMDAMLQCLAGVPHQEFSDKHWEFPRIAPSNLNFKPRVDGYLLPDTPRALYRHHGYHNVSVMMGVVEDEWARSMGWLYKELNDSLIDRDFADGFDRNSFEQSIRHVITERFWWPPSVADSAIYTYTDWENVSDPFVNQEGYKDFSSDLTMKAATVELAETMTNHGTSVFLYNMDHRSVHTDPPWWKCYHSLELDYVFGSPFHGYSVAQDDNRTHPEEDKAISRTLMKLWSNFAKEGHPTSVPVSGVTWEPYQPATSDYLQITSRQLEMRRHFRSPYMAFWNSLVPQLLRESGRRGGGGEGPGTPGSSLGGGGAGRGGSLTDYTMLMWFFAVFALLLFLAVVVLVTRNAKLQKQLRKSQKKSPEAV